MSNERTLTKMKEDSYFKLAQLYQLLKNSNICNQNVNSFYFKAIIDSDFDTQYQLPSDCFLCRTKPQYSGNTVSHFAVEFFNEFNDICLDYLIQHGIDFTIQNDSGFTPLSLALINGKSRCVCKILLYHFQAKDFTNYSCKNGISHLHAACSTNLIDLIKFYITAGVSINQHVKNDSPSFAGYTPLHFAIHYCQAQTIELLLSNGANLNSKDANGMTPLHLLIKKLMKRNTLEIDNEMKIFLQNAIDSNLFKLPDEVGFSYTHLSCILGHLKCEGQNLDIDTPLNLDSPIYPGYTLLHFAAHFYFDTVLLLLKSGANILAEDVNGITPFDLCLIKFNLNEMIKILLTENRHQLSRLKFTNDTTVLGALLAMRSHNGFENYLQCKFKDINTFIPFESPVWPGNNLLHLAVKLNVPIIAILAHQPDFTMQDANGISPLHLAFQMMKEKVVSTIFDYSIFKFANSVDRNNLSVLHIAVAAVNINAITYLLKYGANPNLPTLSDYQWNGTKENYLLIKSGSTPLHIAVHIDCVKNSNLVGILLSYGANPNLFDGNGTTPYHIALNYQCRTVFNKMWKFDNEKGYEKLGLTRLHIACINRDSAMLISELKSGADVNKCINFNSPVWPGDSALHVLCRDQFKAKRDFIPRLLAHGADPNLQNANNFTPVHLSKGELVQIAKFALYKRLCHKNPVDNKNLSHFHLCCSKNSLLLVEKYLKSGVDINTPVDYFADSNPGYTPLHCAVNNKHSRIVELLLNYGADPNIKSADGLTPILLAVSLNIDNISVVRRLLRYPAVDIQATNILGETALGIILQTLCIDEIMLNTFLDKGADLEYKKFISKTVDGQKLINRAICKISVNNFKRLLYNVHDLTLIDDKGQNAIHHVSLAEFSDELSLNFLEAIKALIDIGCELDCRNDEGKTPLHLATSLGHTEMAKILMSIGADINIKDNHGKTPYAYIPDNSEDLKFVFIYYIHKLEILGLYVDKLNKIDLYDTDLNNLSSLVIDEKEKLDLQLKIQVCPTFSATYFLSEKFVNDYQCLPDVQRQKVDLFFISNDLQKYFRHLYYIMNLQFNKARTKLKKNKLLLSAANALKLLTGFHNAEILLEIVKYLNNYCLTSLIHAVN